MSKPKKPEKPKSLAEVALERKRREAEEAERTRQGLEQQRLEKEGREAAKNAEKLHYAPPFTTEIQAEPLRPQPTEPQQVEVVHIHKTDKPLTFASAILWPFAKIFESIRYILKIILEEMLRGAIRFIFGIIFIVLFFAALALFFIFVIAYMETGNFNDTLPRAIEIVLNIFKYN
jgi:hypothetical protein